MDGEKDDSREKWKFAIVISKFVFHLIVASISKAFGVLIPEMVVIFDTDVAVLGLVCSLPVAMMLIVCPIIAHLLTYGRGSSRVISLLGMFLGFFALIMSSYTRSCVLLALYLTMLGIGLAMGYMPFLVTLNDYYSNGFVAMNTLTEIGSSVGVLFIPLLIERCNRAYGYSGAMLILSGIFLHLVAGSATLRPLPSQRSRTMSKNIESLEEPIREVEVGARTLSQSESNRSNYLIGKCKDDQEPGEPKAITDLNPSGRGSELLQAERTYRVSGARDNDYINEDTDEEHSLLNKGIGQTTNDTAQHICKTSSRRESEQNHSVKRFFVNCIFIREPLFTLVLPVYFLTHVSTYAWMLYLVPHAEWQGITSPDAVLLSTIGGVGALLGRIFMVIVLYLGADPFVICCINSAVASATFLFDPWITSYRFMCMTALLQGWTLFLNTTNRASMCKMTTSPHNFALGCGYAALASGIGGTTGGLAAGAIYDATQSFHIVFMFLGLVNVLIALNLLIYLLIILVKGKETKDKTS